jgi:hypothetical protein
MIELHTTCHFETALSAGDIDQRVQAIAKHVFGLKSIIWLYDPKGKQFLILRDVLHFSNLV